MLQLLQGIRLRIYQCQKTHLRTLIQSPVLYQVRDAKKSGGGIQVRSEKDGPSQVGMHLGEKIKENTKTASYTAIILCGVGVTAVMFWAICRELFSSSSPNNIYSEALKRVIEDYRVQDAIGAPIKGYGEESRRGRRQHVAHMAFERNGIPHIRMKFYVQGLRNKATVHLETREDKSGKMEYRYLFVQLDHYPNTTIILEDNRAFEPSSASASQPQYSSANQSALSGSSLSFASFDGKK
ncbi:mitochondrial import inner membrane translocase subunit Tim21 [Stomoxys calcitrans]|uniref:mitochondrial import inner membrane translocase subunit Tim21 n=1 Tax=Stomoxys calcitrans TaxID=35570 RepID=UPI0027E3649E|nr:mitochondrial import inner membrane translocase subunit Tim21 [Stomoxys calcitrans]XP_013114857.2 mitochondrial import inner membrane translocase subunit Tim21 [Stomoxys calcitrans]